MRVERRNHPRGEAGTRVSLEETAKRAAEGRLDPRTRAWAIEKLVQGGNPKSITARASIILTALRRERIYVPDPTDAEFIPSAACTLVGCEGLKFLGEDCDGLLVSFLAAVGSIGIEGAVVGHGYEENGQLSHVLAAIYDGKVWHMGDPSTAQPFGTVSHPKRERWVAVPSGQTMCDTIEGGCDPNKIGSGLHGKNMRPYGDFVGVGAPHGTIGQPSEPTVALQDVGAPYVIDALARRSGELQVRLDDLRYKHIYLGMLRREQLDRPIADVGDPSAPVEGQWKLADEEYYQALIPFTEKALRYTFEAIDGKRAAGYDPQAKSIVIVGDPGEPQLNMSENGDMTVNNAPAGQPAIVPSAYHSAGQVGALPLISILILAGVVVVSLTALGMTYMVTKTVDKAISAATDSDMVTLYNRLIAKGYTPEQANIAVDKVGKTISSQAAAQANLEKEKNKGIGSITETINLVLYGLMGLTLLGVGAYAIVKFGPAVGEAWDERKAAKRGGSRDMVLVGG
jgi:hypothetical protein